MTVREGGIQRATAEIEAPHTAANRARVERDDLPTRDDEPVGTRPAACRRVVRVARAARHEKGRHPAEVLAPARSTSERDDDSEAHAARRGGGIDAWIRGAAHARGAARAAHADAAARAARSTQLRRDVLRRTIFGTTCAAASLATTAFVIADPLERALAPLPRSLRAPAFALTIFALETVRDLGVEFVEGHVLERVYATSEQTPRGWLEDAAKGSAVGGAVLTVVVAVAMLLSGARRGAGPGSRSGLTPPLLAFATVVAPTFVMPLFNLLRARPPANWRSASARSRRATASAGRRSLRFDMSRQTKKANAFVTGVLGTAADRARRHSGRSVRSPTRCSSSSRRAGPLRSARSRTGIAARPRSPRPCCSARRCCGARPGTVSTARRKARGWSSTLHSRNSRSHRCERRIAGHRAPPRVRPLLRRRRTIRKPGCAHSSAWASRISPSSNRRAGPSSSSPHTPRSRRGSARSTPRARERVEHASGMEERRYRASEALAHAGDRAGDLLGRTARERGQRDARPSRA